MKTKPFLFTLAARLLSAAALPVLAILVPALLFTPARPAFALTDQQELIDKSRITFDKLIGSEEFGELPGYMKRAKAIMIFPSLIKGGIILGGEGGSGILLVRNAQKGWSQPAFYTLASGSLGLQLGGQISEVIFTIMSTRALDAILDNQFKFGGGMSMAMGPIGKGIGGSTTTNLESDIYTFAKTSGLFGGVSLDGAGILKRDSWNAAYYGKGATPYAIVIQGKYQNPNTHQLLNSLAPY